MPDNLLPCDPSTENYLSDAEAEEFRLSSKTHIDVPIEIGDEVVHALAAHPTPPVFDGEGNFNGKRNHDEIRLLADYAAGADYIYDDSGRQGGLDDDSYVLMGDMNAAPGDTETLNAATEYFVENDGFVATPFPTSPGGAAKNEPRSRYWTAEFGLQVDYVLPSPDLGRDRSSVVWPSAATTERGLLDAVRTASDHRLVWADVPIEREDAEDDPERDDGDDEERDEDGEDEEDDENDDEDVGDEDEDEREDNDDEEAEDDDEEDGEDDD